MSITKSFSITLNKGCNNYEVCNKAIIDRLCTLFGGASISDNNGVWLDDRGVAIYDTNTVYTAYNVNEGDIPEWELIALVVTIHHLSGEDAIFYTRNGEGVIYC